MKLKLIPLLICAAAAASAQLYPAKLGMVQDASFHLGEPRVQIELKMSSAQVQSVVDLLNKHAEGQRGFGTQLNSAKPDQYGAIQRQMDALDGQTSSRLVGTLTVPQKKRLRQMALQANGPFAIRNISVAQDLALTPEQRQKVEAVAQTTIKTMDALSGKQADDIVKLPQPNPQDTKAVKTYESKKITIMKRYQPQLDQIEKKGKNGVLALLTPAQKTKWKTLLGKPFKL